MFQFYTKILLLLWFVTEVFAVKGQQYSFKQYTLEDGLSHPYVYTINNDTEGFLWVGTGEGLCKFDGFSFSVSEADDTLTNGFVTSSLLDSEGRLWFGHNSGEITYYKHGGFTKIPTDEYTSSTIIDISESPTGEMFFASQNSGVLRVSKEDKVDTFKNAFTNKLLSSLEILKNGYLIVGAHDGLYLYQSTGSEIEEIQKIEGLPYSLITTIVPVKNDDVEAFWLGTEDEGFWKIIFKSETYDVFEIEHTAKDFGLEWGNVQQLEYDQLGNLWVSTFGSGIYKLLYDKEPGRFISQVHYNKGNGLSNDYVKDLFTDWEGNIWIGTYGGGLSLSVDEAFSFRFQSVDDFPSDITAIARSENYLWLGSKAKLLRYHTESGEKKIFTTSQGLPQDKITALYADKEAIWLGTESEGVYTLNSANNRFQSYYDPDNSLEKQINHITADDNFIWISTGNGAVRVSRVDSQRELFNTYKGWPHNDISSIYIDSQNRAWVATKSNGIFVVGSNESFSIEGNVKLEFASITEDMNGDIWAATYGDGVFKFHEDSLQYFSSDDGLRSNYCYSIASDSKGHIWIGHRLGLSRINIESGEIQIFSKDAGITGDCNRNAFIKSATGELLFGTTEGVIQYDPRKDRENVNPPRIAITNLQFNDQKFPAESIVLPYDAYKVEIDYVGVSFSDPQSVHYQYKLEGYDFEWSDKTKQRKVVYPRLEDGDYVLKIKACNADGFCTEAPLDLSIKIKAPIWKRWWFLLSSAVILIGAVWFLIKYRERKQKEMQEYLEKELASRTKEVMSQRDLLEQKNRDITDSINYAKRIQQSILPSVVSLNEMFTGSFVFYKPRDIVSGDFYWYDRVNDDKFLIVCADSTGHGVPGAFMSMIGTTLIKDICMREDVNSPSEILAKLDAELQGTLNQNVDAETSNDGMDIIVCEIDVHTHYMRFASAMRPIILYKKKQLQYVMGNKCSIGGMQDDQKRFENIGFQLEKGDIVYMFSDGYPDQFGGPRGKKFKLARLKNLLTDICVLPMDEQHDKVSDAFKAWKGKHYQVDDVLFMGVKL